MTIIISIAVICATIVGLYNRKTESEELKIKLRVQIEKNEELSKKIEKLEKQNDTVTSAYCALLERSMNKTVEFAKQ